MTRCRKLKRGETHRLGCRLGVRCVHLSDNDAGCMRRAAEARQCGVHAPRSRGAMVRGACAALPRHACQGRSPQKKRPADTVGGHAVRHCYSCGREQRNCKLRASPLDTHCVAPACDAQMQSLERHPRLLLRNCCPYSRATAPPWLQRRLYDPGIPVMPC
eukprot:364752-Chlamydomonas_euryale.AAC.10